MLNCWYCYDCWMCDFCGKVLIHTHTCGKPHPLHVKNVLMRVTVHSLRVTCRGVCCLVSLSQVIGNQVVSIVHVHFIWDVTPYEKVNLTLVLPCPRGWLIYGGSTECWDHLQLLEHSGSTRPSGETVWTPHRGVPHTQCRPAPAWVTRQQQWRWANCSLIPRPNPLIASYPGSFPCEEWACLWG